MAYKQQDFAAMMKDMMGAFPVDTTAMNDAFKTTATLNEKLSGVAIEAAEKSTELSAKWTKETLSRLSEISRAKTEPADYAKAMTEFASAQAEMTAEHMSAFAEIAKKVQMDTVELDFSEDATAAMKKASADAAAGAKKTASAGAAAAK